MQHAWGRPAGTCRRIVARDAEQGNEASWVTNHLFLRHVSPMNWKICLTKLLRLNWIYKKKTRGEAGREVRERSPKDASAATKTPAKIKSPFTAPCRHVDSKALRQGGNLANQRFIMFVVHLSLPEAQISPIFPKKKKPFANHAPTSCRKPSCEVAPRFSSDFLNRSCDHHGGHRHAGHEAHFG